MVTLIWVNIGLVNGLLPGHTKSLHKRMLTWDYWRSSQCYFTENAQDMLAKFIIWIQLIKYFYDLPGTPFTNKGWL